MRPSRIRDNKMKKFALVLIAILCFATAYTNAQVYTDNVEGTWLCSMPGLFSANGHPYLVAATSIGSLCVLDCELNMIAKVDNDNKILEAYYMDADATSIAVADFHNTLDHGLLLTQTLFNSDDYFEFIEMQGYESYHYHLLNIKSSNGTIIQSISADEGYFFADSRCAFVVKIQNYLYLVLRESKNNGGATKHAFYLIKKDHGLTEVDVDLPISVFPTVSNRDQQITVELGENIDAYEITIVNGVGQVIKRLPLESGQREITIPAGELAPGLNLLNTCTQQGQSCCKIIVH